MAKKTGGASTVGSNRTCFDRRSGEDEYGNDVSQSEGRFCNTIYMPWMWIGEIEITTTVRSLIIWQEIAGIGEQKTELGKEEDWNTDRIIDKD